MADCLYIHIPFCARKCVYCDFYSTLYTPGTAEDYIEALAGQIKPLKGPFSTVYIGGGTPSALDKKLLEKLLGCLKGCLGEASEFTVEANPESLDADKLKLMSDRGVNRLSIGIQSLDDRKLRRLGRIHDSHKAEEAVYLAAKKGFKNISVDLIFGAWGESEELWEKDLKKALILPVTHISCYSLTYERHTPLFSMLKNKSIAPLEEKVVADMYERAIDRLSVRGFKQYEISNFSKEGYRCAHNLNYWDNNPYLGLGPCAVSYMNGVRSKNISDISEYIRYFRDGKNLVESSEKLSPLKRARETAALKIRTKEGIDFARFKEKTGFDFPELEKKAIGGLIEKGLIKYNKEGSVPTGICLKRKGFLFCDIVSSALL